MPESTFSRRFANFWACPRVILPHVFTPGPSTTLPQSPGRYPIHPGPILTSQLLLEGDSGPETCQNRLFRAILGPPRKTYLLLLSKHTLDLYMMSIGDLHTAQRCPRAHTCANQMWKRSKKPFWPNIGQIFGKGCPLGFRPKLKRGLEASKNIFSKNAPGIFLVTAFLNTY